MSAELRPDNSEWMTPDAARYRSAVRSMNHLVKLVDRPESPHSIRQGINTALRDHGSLVDLLIAKGVITQAEYFRAIADGMEKEVGDYAQMLAAKCPNHDVRVCDGMVQLTPREGGAAGEQGGVKP
jgi:hypothetical protein